MHSDRYIFLRVPPPTQNYSKGNLPNYERKYNTPPPRIPLPNEGNARQRIPGFHLQLRCPPNLRPALLDAVVLAVVSKEKEGTYGYKITQDVRGVLDVSESTLYPVLRRLQKDDCLEVYDMAYAGRNRRYYKLTDRGAAQLEFYKAEWKIYASKISGMFEGGIG